MFAQTFAVRESDFGQRVRVVRASTPKPVAKRIDSVISEWIAEPGALAVTVLLPKVASLEVLTKVALELAQLGQHWRVDRRQITYGSSEQAIAFQVTRSLMTETGASVPSEALVLGPFRPFPPTRMAPVTAFEMYVGTPAAVDLKGQPRTKANIADVPTTPPLPAAAVARMWPGSRDRRLEQLGGVEDSRAKAKVSFVVPIKLAQSLGCWP